MSAIRRREPPKRKEPRAGRLTVPGYEVAPGSKGLLSWKWAETRLKMSRQYWIATARPDRTPHLMIIWGVWLGDSLWFSTGARSRKGRNLAANPRCSIGTDNAAEAVILEGSVELIDQQHPEFGRFAAAYEKKYSWSIREMAQPVYRFGPTVGFGLFEKKFDQTATRWSLG